MQELVIFQHGEMVLNPKTAIAIADLEREIKTLTEKQKAIKKALLGAMQQHNVCKLSTPEVTVQYIAPTNRETFDAKEFRKSCPELYDEFVKINPVSASVRVTVK